MLMDKMTEMVAHLIGIFHTTLEEERMRDTFDKFKALQAADTDNDPIAAMEIAFKAKYTLDGFTPGLRYADQTQFNPWSDIASPSYSEVNYPIANLPQIGSAPTNTFSTFNQALGGGAPRLTLEPPSSVAVIVAQSAFLTDNDLILLGSGETVFTDPAEFLAEQQQYQTIAMAIAAPISAEMITPGEDATLEAIALHSQLSDANITTLSGVIANMLHGADVAGIHINGENVDEGAVLDDLWPVFKSDDQNDVDETEDTDGASADHEFPDAFDGLDDGYSNDSSNDIDDGHAVVAGANTLVNEIAINSAWLDAPVISVMGDVVHLNVISQINVLVDHDTGTFGDVVESTAINAATFSVTSTTPVPEEGDEEEETVSSSTESLGLPSNWAVTHIEGDLIALNQIHQYNFVTDNDRAEITFSSANTYIGMGDNTVINITSLSELGFGYDLIMIGGSMISVNWINQINVLIDNDTVTFTGDIPDGLSGSDNLLFNSATINSVGLDSYGEMQDNFVAASEALANGALTIDESVAHDSVFEGVELLRVLYIEGDLTTVNWIEQTNVMGDSDQVHLALEDLEAATGATATVTTGSNSVINIATVNEYGIDTSVAVNGDVYDDALLYQAELIDTDADPLGVNMPTLASEAVVFLADDMLGPDIGPTDAPIVATASESTTSSDVMQSMLA